MLIKSKSFIYGVIITILLLTSVTTLAGGIQKNIEVVANQVNIEVNGNRIEVDNFLYNGTTYVPLRAISETLGKVVGWDGYTNTASINDKDYYTKPVQKLTIEEISKLSRSIVLIKATTAGGSLATGSGFVIDSSGKIVTNFHIIKGASTITFVYDNKEYPIEGLINYSVEKDIAVIKFDNRTLKLASVPLGNSTEINLGQEVVAIGNPMGLTTTISNGIISSSRNIDGQNFIQMTAPISSGSSGGALFNMYGEVIGITTSSYVNGQNLNLAIPVDEVKKFIDYKLVNVSDVKANSTSNQTNSTLDDISLVKLYSEITDKYVRLENIGEIIRDTTDILDIAFDNIYQNNDTSYLQTVRTKLNESTDYYSAELPLISALINKCKFYNIDISDMNIFLTNYYNALNYYELSLQGLNSYSLNLNRSSFDMYLNNSSNANKACNLSLSAISRSYSVYYYKIQEYK